MDEQHITHIALQQHRASSSYSERETAVASHLTISTIRHLHTLGLIQGEETSSGLLYSEREVAQLRRIRRLRHDPGVNLAGVEVILHLLKRLEAVH
jgi:MerR family transcriptional regulator/heat shock protein HspR